jgi:hypothetical protein
MEKKTLLSPGAQHGVPWNGGDVLTLDADKFAFEQTTECILYAAFREADILGYVCQSNLYPGTALAMSHPPKEEVNKEGRGLAIMPDQPAHQRIENVGIDFKHRHQSYGNRCYSR